MKDEKENEVEDTTPRTISGQSLAQDGTEEELTVQKQFVSLIPCHDQCTMDLPNHAVTKLRNV
jgi:hypothetical protein